MSDDRTAIAGVLVITVVAAFLAMIHHVDIRQGSSDAPPGTIGLARPHPPLYPSGATQN